VRGGPDPEEKLQASGLAIEKAPRLAKHAERQYSQKVPFKRGSGGIGRPESLWKRFHVYEGYGRAGVAILVSCNDR